MKQKLSALLIIYTILLQPLYAIEVKKADNPLKLKDLKCCTDEVSVRQSAILGAGSADIFKKMNYTTAALVIASMVTGREGKASHDHKILGATAGSFFAAQTLFVKPSSGLSWSEGLYWLSVPFLFLAPILGGSRADDIDKGRTSTGMTKNHKTIAKIGAWAYLASVALWTFDF